MKITFKETVIAATIVFIVIVLGLQDCYSDMPWYGWVLGAFSVLGWAHLCH